MDDITDEERQENLAGVPKRAKFPYHKGGGWYVTEEGEIVQGDPSDDDDTLKTDPINPEIDAPIGAPVTEDSAAAQRGEQAALGTPLPVETADEDLSEVEKLAKEHRERNALAKVNRAGYSPDAPHPSEREPNEAHGRRSKNDE